MVALTDLICATTPDEYSELQSQFRAEQAAKPSDSEVLTAFMRGCTDFAGEPPLVKTNTSYCMAARSSPGN